MIHDFKADLEFSRNNASLDIWEKIYRLAFPLFKGMSYVTEKPKQLAGIDREVLLKNGKVITIDEKVRRENWNDFLLEYWSDKEREVLGWICKPLQCDYLAYAFLPSKRCYLLPFDLLQRAWKKNAKAWHEQAKSNRGYKVVEANNPNYTTVSLAVPIDIVLNSIKEAMLIHYD